MRKARRKSSASPPTATNKSDSESHPPLYRDEWLSQRQFAQQAEKATRDALTELVLHHPEQLEKTIGTRYKLLERSRIFTMLWWSIGILMLLGLGFVFLHGTHSLLRAGFYTNGMLKIMLLAHSATDVDSWGESLLHALCESPSPQLSTYSLLVSHGLSVNQIDLFGRTPLHLCAAKSIPISLQMLGDGARAPRLGQRTILNIVFDALPLSYRVKEPALFLQLLQAISDTHQKNISANSLNLPTPSNYSMLCKCYLMGRTHAELFNFCDWLVARGANLNDPRSCRGDRPLLHQVLSDTGVIYLHRNASIYLDHHLLRYPTLDVNVLDEEGQNAAYYAGNVSQFDALVRLGLHTHVVNHGGENLLDHHMKRMAKYPTVAQAELLARVYDSGVRELAATNIRPYLVNGNDSATESIKLSKHVEELVRFAKDEHRLPQLRGLSAVVGHNKNCFEEHASYVIYVYENSYLEKVACPVISALPLYDVKIVGAVDRIPTKEDLSKAPTLPGGKRHVLPLISRGASSSNALACEVVYLRAAVSPANITSVNIEIDGGNVTV